MYFDFTALRGALASGRLTPQQALAASHQASQQAANAHAYTLYATPTPSTAAPFAAHLPLAGAAVSVKALFDVQGWVTHAGSAVLREQPPASADAPAIARLRAAGAHIAGHSHMVEFAFSGVGTNPHYTTPAGLDGLWGQDLGGRYVPGGSSSGAGVSVASGSAWIGLGSDTGGSIRIPAALNGLVGFKSTTGLVPTEGTVPLSTSLDTACAITRSVRDAVLAHEVLSQRRITRSSAPLSAWRLAVPQQWMLDELEPAVAQAFERSLAVLQKAGARITRLDLPELHAITEINAVGGLIAAESHAWHAQLLATRSADYDPRVQKRLVRGASISAADYIHTHERRRAWIAQMRQRLQGVDALLSPTTPITAPLLAAVAPATPADTPEAAKQRERAFFAANALLLRNTSVVNMLNGCAISLPCHQPGELPMGLMLWQAGGYDSTVLNVAALAEQALLQAALAQGAQRHQPLQF